MEVGTIPSMDAFLTLHQPLAYVAALLFTITLGAGWAFGNALGAWMFAKLSAPRRSQQPA